MTTSASYRHKKIPNLVRINRFSRIIDEYCVLMYGCYLGIESGKLYPMSEYQHAPVYRARVIAVVAHQTGMIYRDDLHCHDHLIGREVEVVKAHRFGEYQVWCAIPEVAYLSENEIELLSEEPVL